MGNCFKKSRRQVLPSISGGARTSSKTGINDSKLSLRPEDEVKPQESKSDRDIDVIGGYPDCVLVTICSHLLLDEVKPKVHNPEPKTIEVKPIESIDVQRTLDVKPKTLIEGSTLIEVKPKNLTDASTHIDVKSKTLFDALTHIEVKPKTPIDAFEDKPKTIIDASAQLEVKPKIIIEASAPIEVKPTDHILAPRPLIESKQKSPFHASNESIYDELTEVEDEVAEEVAEEIAEQEEDDLSYLPNTVTPSVNEDKLETGPVGSGKVQLDMGEVEKAIKRLYVLKRSKSNSMSHQSTDGNDDDATNDREIIKSDNTEDDAIVSFDDRAVLNDIPDNSECSHDSSTISVKRIQSPTNAAAHIKDDKEDTTHNENETLVPSEDCLVPGVSKEADETLMVTGDVIINVAKPLKDEQISSSTPNINGSIPMTKTRDEKATLEDTTTVTADQQQEETSCQGGDILGRQVSLSECKSVSSATMNLMLDSVSQNNSQETQERKTVSTNEESLQSYVRSKYISHDILNSQNERIDIYRGNRKSDQTEHLSTHKVDYLSDKSQIIATSTADNIQGAYTNKVTKSVTKNKMRDGIEHDQIPGTSKDTDKFILKAAHSDNVSQAVGESEDINLSEHKSESNIESIRANPRESAYIDFETKRQISLTFLKSLEVVRNHIASESRSDCEFGVYISAPPGESTPRLVQVRASNRQVKDGVARKFIKEMKDIISEPLPCIDPLPREQNTYKKHLNTASSLIDSDIEVHWREKKGPTTNPQLTTVPASYKPGPQRKRLCDMFELEKLHKYGIIPQCKAIEIIKVDEEVIPAILPPKARKKLKEKKNEKRFMN